MPPTGPDDWNPPGAEVDGLRREVGRVLRETAAGLDSGEEGLPAAAATLDFVERVFPFEAGARHLWRMMTAGGSSQGRTGLADWMRQRAAELDPEAGEGLGIGPDGV